MVSRKYSYFCIFSYKKKNTEFQLKGIYMIHSFIHSNFIFEKMNQTNDPHLKQDNIL